MKNKTPLQTSRNMVGYKYRLKCSLFKKCDSPTNKVPPSTLLDSYTTLPITKGPKITH